MDPQSTKAIIEEAGGDAAFARLLGIDKKPGFQQRVNNWKRRGIPGSVAYEHYSVIQRLALQAASQTQA